MARASPTAASTGKRRWACSMSSRTQWRQDDRPSARAAKRSRHKFDNCGGANASRLAARLKRDDLSINHHRALTYCLRMISAQTLPVCREGNPLRSFHALAPAADALDLLVEQRVFLVHGIVRI